MPGNSSGLMLLDAAGTLIHPAEAVENVYESYFSQSGWITSPADLRTSFRKTFGSLADPDFHSLPGDAAERAWWRQVVERTAQAVGITPHGEVFENCFTNLFDHYAQGTAWHIYPEVEDVLASLRRDGWKLALVSNFDRRLHRVMEELGLTPAIDLILTSADVGARKPAPHLLRAAIARFPATKHICHIGDSDHADGGAARAAGIPFYLVDRPHTDLRGLTDWLKITFY